MLLIEIGGGKMVNREGIIRDLVAVRDFFIILQENVFFLEEAAESWSMSSGDIFPDRHRLDQIISGNGLENKRLVELCQIYGIQAVGLSGIDGKLIQSRCRSYGKGRSTREHGDSISQLMGKPSVLNFHFLSLLLENGFHPVLTTPISDERGKAIYTCDEDILVLLQQELHAEQVIFLLELSGLAQNTRSGKKISRRISLDELMVWEKETKGVLKRKLQAIISMAKKGSSRIIIADGCSDHPLHDALRGWGVVIEPAGKQLKKT